MCCPGVFQEASKLVYEILPEIKSNYSINFCHHLHQDTGSMHEVSVCILKFPIFPNNIHIDA